ncbi:MAG: type II toxin-antitoxin system VapC family toxin [Geminicoccaceae bacterium]
MTLVVDASVALKWYLIEDGAEPARQILADGDTLVAPELIVAEVCNACWLAGRRGEISPTQQSHIAADITRVFDRLEGLVPHASRAMAIARELDHPVYDCFYLALSEALDARLVTADGRLLARVAGTPFAARTHGLKGYTPPN